MIKHILQLFFLTAFTIITCQNISNSEEIAGNNLATVVLIFRHGDRVPIRPYPTDPYKNSSYWPVDWGQLTNKGKQQHYELGQWFKRRYVNFLPEKYNEKNIYVRSTDVDRTLMSAEANLAGLFIPQENEIWNPKIHWQPIPIHTKPEKEDPILAMKKPCPKYDYLLEENTHRPELVEIKKKYKYLFEYLTKYTGQKVKTITELEYVYSTLKIETLFNFTLPSWTDKVFPSEMEPIAFLSFALSCYTKDLARLKVGPLMAEIMSHFYNVSETKPKANRKLFMYSAHDTTIANVLQAMDLFQYHSPPYTSTILLELYKRNDDAFYVNILYKNSSVPQKMMLPGCEFNCPLEQFASIISAVTLPEDSWEEECRMSMLSYLPFNNFQSIFVITSLGILILLLIIILISVLCTKKGQNRRQHFSYFRIPDRDENV